MSESYWRERKSVREEGRRREKQNGRKMKREKVIRDEERKRVEAIRHRKECSMKTDVLKQMCVCVCVNVSVCK